MLLGKHAIEFCLRHGWIGCDPPPVRVTENSFAVTLGDEFAVPVRGSGVVDPHVDDPLMEYQLVKQGSIEIEPGHFVIARSLEGCGSRVRWLSPQIRTRSTVACWGVEIGVAALWGEPGFCGVWRLEINNTRGTPVVLYAGDEVGQMSFFLTLFGELYGRQYLVQRDEWRIGKLLPKHLEDRRAVTRALLGSQW